jgi:hypothetical protein
VTKLTLVSVLWHRGSLRIQAGCDSLARVTFKTELTYYPEELLILAETPIAIQPSQTQTPAGGKAMLRRPLED